MSTEIGSLFVSLAVNKGTFGADMNDASKQLSLLTKLGAGLTAAGGAVIGTLGLMVNNLISTADAFDEMSQRTGVSTEALRSYGYMADLAGGSTETIEKAFTKMAQSLSSGKADASLDKLGISLTTLAKLKPEDQFKLIASKLADVNNQTEKVAIATNIFGKSAAVLLPLLEGGSKAFAKRTEEARKATEQDEKAQKAAKDLKDEYDKMFKSIVALSNQLATNLIPLTKQLIYITQSLIGFISNFVSKYETLIKVLVISATILGVVATAMGLLIGSVSAIVLALPALTAAVALLGGASGLGMIAGVITGVIAAGVLLIEHWDDLKLAALNVASTILTVLSSALGNIPIIGAQLKAATNSINAQILASELELIAKKKAANDKALNDKKAAELAVNNDIMARQLERNSKLIAGMQEYYDSLYNFEVERSKLDRNLRDEDLDNELKTLRLSLDMQKISLDDYKFILKNKFELKETTYKNEFNSDRINNNIRLKELKKQAEIELKDYIQLLKLKGTAGNDFTAAVTKKTAELNNKISALQSQNISKQIQGEKKKNDLILADRVALFNAEKAIEDRKMMMFQTSVSSVMSVANNLDAFQAQTNANRLKNDLATEEESYNTKRDYILAHVTDKTQQEKELTALDAEHSKKVKNIEDAAAKEEKKRKEAMKPLLIAEAVANTAIGVTKAFAQGGMFGFVTGALVAAAGAIQIATIQAQQFAKGGIVGGNSFTGDNVPAMVNSGEMILNSGQQARLFNIANGSTTNNNGYTFNISMYGSDKKYADVVANRIVSKINQNRKW